MVFHTNQVSINVTGTTSSTADGTTGLVMIVQLCGLGSLGGSMCSGDVSGTTTTSAMSGIVMMIRTSLVFLDRLEVAVTVSSTGGDVSGTTMTIGMDWVRSLCGRARAVYDVAVATTASGELNKASTCVKDRKCVNGTYRCIGVMMGSGIFIDVLGRFSVSVGITRRGADISSTTSARVSKLGRVR